MDRIVLERFKAWKNKKNRKPLLVTGVRQCGKTWLITQNPNYSHSKLRI